jgi:single-strand DNA-binding protein
MDVWDDKATGQKRSKLKVVADNLQFLPDGKGGPTRQFSENSSNGHDGGSRQGGSAAPADDYQEEDDIPF